MFFKIIISDDEDDVEDKDLADDERKNSPNLYNINPILEIDDSNENFKMASRDHNVDMPFSFANFLINVLPYSF